MLKPFKSYVSQTISELDDKLGWMMLNAPKFEDELGYFPGMNLETTFIGLNESLDTLRSKLGEELYAKMRDMSDSMRALFEVDPEIKTGEAVAGCRIIQEMELMLRRKPAAPK